jgi:hypothetical protein
MPYIHEATALRWDFGRVAEFDNIIIDQYIVGIERDRFPLERHLDDGVSELL